MQRTIKRTIKHHYNRMLSTSEKAERFILVSTSTIGASAVIYGLMAAMHVIEIY